MTREQIDAMLAALTPYQRVSRYLDLKRDTMRRGIDSEFIHSIHTGTEMEAHITVSDLRAVLAAKDKAGAK